MTDAVLTREIPLVVHVVYALDFGGLEALLVDTVNQMPAERFRHAIVCITRYTDFAKRIERPGVELYALDKQPGLGLGTHWTFWKLMRRLRPAIVHTYNLAAYEYGWTAAMAGVPVRIHAEHGRDARDPQGTNPKHRLLRRMLAPWIDMFVPVSLDLQGWLQHTIGVARERIALINNGVDTLRFAPGPVATDVREALGIRSGEWVIGSVGRIQDVKDQATLLRAFAQLLALAPEAAPLLRLVIVGEGPLLPALRTLAQELGIAPQVSLPGARHDIDQVMRCFSVFALSSIAEGTPVTLLEAMSTGLPVVATRVGGIPDLVHEGRDGQLVAPRDPAALAQALLAYVRDPQLLARHASAGRAHIEAAYSTRAMVANYAALYDRVAHSKHLFS